MKKLTILILLLLAISFPQVAYADLQQDLTEQVQTGLGNLDFSQVETVSGGYIGDIVEKISQIINFF